MQACTTHQGQTQKSLGNAVASDGIALRSPALVLTQTNLITETTTSKNTVPLSSAITGDKLVDL